MFFTIQTYEFQIRQEIDPTSQQKLIFRLMIMKGMTTIIQCLYKQIYAGYDKIDF